MNSDDVVSPETLEEIEEYEAMYKRQQAMADKSKTKVEVNIRIPNMSAENARIVVRDIRRTLENCAGLRLLDEFVETQQMKHKEGVPK